MARYAIWAVAIAALIALPFVYRDLYHLHILVLILIWSFAYTSWSMMGRFGLVSLGHGGFMGVGAYVTALLWNHLGVSPWIGIPLAMAAAAALAVVVREIDGLRLQVGQNGLDDRAELAGLGRRVSCLHGDVDLQHESHRMPPDGLLDRSYF